MEIQGAEKREYYLIKAGDSFDSKVLLDAREVIENAIEKGFKNFLFDFSLCSYLDSSGIGLIVNLHKQGKVTGGKLGILNASEKIKEIFFISNMEKVINLYDSEERFITDLH
jgi:anti-sigma B factor antagonist